MTTTTKQNTIRASFTEDELEEIMDALCFYDVKYYMVKKDKEHEQVCRDYWQGLSNKNSEIWSKCFDLQKKLRTKYSKVIDK